MSYETFKKGLTDRNDGCYMDMERLMNTVYPVDAASLDEIYQWKAHPLCALFNERG